MKVLTVVTHPREDSLTFRVADQFIDGLASTNHGTEVLDLYRSEFSPVLREEDEPDWTSETKKFSTEVEQEIQRLKNFDALAFVFPVWWWSMPAMLKGYIDRVWNHGYAYGVSSSLSHKQILWLGLVGSSQEQLQKRGYDVMMEHYFNIGLADYCGVQNSKLELMYETIEENNESQIKRMLTKAHHIGINF